MDGRFLDVREIGNPKIMSLFPNKPRVIFLHRTVELLQPLTDENKPNIHVDNEKAFRSACYNGHIEVVQLLLSLTGEDKINVHANDEEAFRWACYSGHAEVVRLLLSLTGEDKIDIHPDNERAFRWACYRGHVEIVKLLLSLSDHPNIYVEDEWGFKWACERGHVEIVRLLIEESIKDGKKWNVNIRMTDGVKELLIQYGLITDEKYQLHKNTLVSVCDEVLNHNVSFLVGEFLIRTVHGFV